MIIADTSALLAYFNSREPSHTAVKTFLDDLDEPLVVSPYVVAELDYLVATRIGVEAELEVLDELASGAYELSSFGTADVRRARAVVDRYHDLGIGLTDASLVVLAQRHSTRTITTLDHKHFNVLRPLTGGRFRIVP